MAADGSADPQLNAAATVLRLLYISDLRELQTKINELIVSVQNHTANPRVRLSLSLSDVFILCCYSLFSPFQFFFFFPFSSVLLIPSLVCSSHAAHRARRTRVWAKSANRSVRPSSVVKNSTCHKPALSGNDFFLGSEIVNIPLPSRRRIKVV